MRSLPVPTTLLMAVVLAAAACAQEQEAPESTVGSAAYLGAVEELLAPPSRLASVTAERLADPEAPPVDVAALADDARREREDFAALALRSPVLERQRDRLAEAYGELLATLDPVVAAHHAGDDERLAAAARPFYESLQALPAAVPPPDAP